VKSKYDRKQIRRWKRYNCNKLDWDSGKGLSILFVVFLLVACAVLEGLM